MIRASFGGMATIEVDEGAVHVSADSPELEAALVAVSELAARTMNGSPSVYDHDLELVEEIAKVSGLGEFIILSQTDPPYVPGRIY